MIIYGENMIITNDIAKNNYYEYSNKDIYKLVITQKVGLFVK